MSNLHANWPAYQVLSKLARKPRAVSTLADARRAMTELVTTVEVRGRAPTRDSSRVAFATEASFEVLEVAQEPEMVSLWFHPAAGADHVNPFHALTGKRHHGRLHRNACCDTWHSARSLTRAGPTTTSCSFHSVLSIRSPYSEAGPIATLRHSPSCSWTAHRPRGEPGGEVAGLVWP